MKNLHIRPATQDDLAILLTFEQGIVEAERPYDSTLKPGEIHYYDLAALIDSKEAEVLVVVDDDEIVGSGYAKVAASSGVRQHDFHAYLGFMYVKPSHRGQGVNQLILDALLEWATARDIFEIQLEVYPDNEAAMRAYSKAGFRPHLLRMRLDSRQL